MHLSKRLQMVADCVSPNSLVADVGCDHAYISIYLVENEIAKHSVALDINEGPLQKAKENVKDSGLSDKISIRLSDGLEKLCPGEANSIVIAGMGGILMVQILSSGLDCVKAANELILQPQSEAEKVREYLHILNFSICEENMCIDDGKYYVVIHAKKEEVKEEVREEVKEEVIEELVTEEKKEKQEVEVVKDVKEVKDEKEVNLMAKQESNKEAEASIVWRTHNKYGELLLSKRHPVLYEYLVKEHHKAMQIQASLLEHPSEKNNLRYEQIKEELEMLEYGLSFYTPLNEITGEIKKI